MAWSNQNSYILLVRRQNGPTILERNFLEFLKELNMHLRHDTVIPLIDIFPREIKIYVHTHTCAQLFIVALLVIGPN